MSEIVGKDIERFRAAIGRGLGLHFDEAKFGFLAEVLRRRIDDTRQRPDVYLSSLELTPAREELNALGRELTVPETYFFRNIDQYRALRDAVLPELLAGRATERRLRLLSLGCASGEEAYSLAMLVRDVLPNRSWDASVVGVDVNASMIEKARRGRFSAWALRQTPEEDRRRWFRFDGKDFVLDASIRASVCFEHRNLLDPDPVFWQPAAYDVVFCRNVIMYFTPERARSLVARIARSVSADGYLFLGHAETLRQVSDDFELRHTHGAFYYKRKTAGGPARSLAGDALPADTWVDVIQQSSARVAALADARLDPPTHRGPGSAGAMTWDVGHAFELLRQERFAEALAMVEGLPAASQHDPEVRRLRAALLVHAGRFADAEEACRGLLDDDDRNAGAHYLLALCREAAGDSAEALYRNQIAIHLDPGFAMPRLHVGLAARRSRDWSVARRELRHAIALLQREDPSRLLLFGGGFGRAALIALCRTGLQRCEEDRAR